MTLPNTPSYRSHNLRTACLILLAPCLSIPLNVPLHRRTTCVLLRHRPHFLYTLANRALPKHLRGCDKSCTSPPMTLPASSICRRARPTHPKSATCDVSPRRTSLLPSHPTSTISPCRNLAKSSINPFTIRRLTPHAPSPLVPSPPPNSLTSCATPRLPYTGVQPTLDMRSLRRQIPLPPSPIRLLSWPGLPCCLCLLLMIFALWIGNGDF
jgi:hypothetical protein